MEKVKLKVGHLPIVDHLILGMTKSRLDKGTESFAHCELETVSMFGWNEVGDAIVSGEVDIAFMLAPYAMDLFYAKKNLKLVLLSHRSGSVFVANKSANIKKLEDFKNKTVLIPYNSSVHFMILHKMFQAVGMDIGPGKDVMTEVVAPAQIPEMIEYDSDGVIGGYIVAEPFGTCVVQDGRGELLKLSKEVWDEHPCCAVIVRDEIIEKYPEAINEVVASLNKSGAMCKSDTEEAIAVGIEFLNQGDRVVRAILEDPRERVVTSRLLPNLQEFEEIQDYLTSKVPTPTMSGKIDLEKFVDLRFAKNAGAK